MARRGAVVTTFFNHVLEHGLVQGQLRDQLLQSRVLVLELPHLPNLIRLQASIRFLPAIESLLTDADLANQLGDRQASLRLLQHRHKLLDCKPLSLHGQISHPNCEDSAGY
jgi:hypothetical protein